MVVTHLRQATILGAGNERDAVCRKNRVGAGGGSVGLGLFEPVVGTQLVFPPGRVLGGLAGSVRRGRMAQSFVIWPQSRPLWVELIVGSSCVGIIACRGAPVRMATFVRGRHTQRFHYARLAWRRRRSRRTMASPATKAARTMPRGRTRLQMPPVMGRPWRKGLRMV